MTEGRVGTSPLRVDGRSKVTGAAQYSVDWQETGMLYGQVVRATRAHAEIISIDATGAAAVPGVTAVITAVDLKSLFRWFGHIVADHPILAVDKVRYFGEPVALVVADNPYSAADAANAVIVQYRDLPVMIQPEEAMEASAPLLHEDDYAAGDRSFSEARSGMKRSNVAHTAEIEWGDTATAFVDAAAVIETEVRYPMLYAYAMEPYNATARFESGALDVVSTAQHPFQVREDLARIFDLPLNRVRVRSLLLGGGYGSKSYTKVEPLAAIGAWFTGRTVKVSLDVEGSIHTTRADSALVKVRSAFDEKGKILAREFDILLNTGAYTDNGALVLTKSVLRCFGPYVVPNLRAAGKAVFTNTVPSSSYRGFGAPQGNLAGETNMDQAAAALGLDAAEIRRINLVGPGERHIPGKRPMDADLWADLDMVLETLGWAKAGIEEGHGLGFGCSASDAGAIPVSTATVRLFADGSATVLTGSTEMGQGSRTALAQVAASELGIGLDRIRVIQSDTAVTPYERTTGASRTTTLTGLAVQRACLDVMAKLEEMGAEVLECDLEEIKSAEGVVAGPDRQLDYDEVVQQWFGGRQGEVTGVGVVRRSGDLAELPPFWEIGMVGVEVSVDRDTGRITVEHLVTVGDVGYAINPTLVEGQDLGAATQGLGAALGEELIYDGPQLVNANVVDYRVPRTTDVPKRINNLIAERADGVGPFGAKGAGEGALNPIGGAVASAVARAIGKWPTQLPLTPERVWVLLNEIDEN